jgi:Raf kinase inhibitor-like YbhB/YbcL family protein
MRRTAWCFVVAATVGVPWLTASCSTVAVAPLDDDNDAAVGAEGGTNGDAGGGGPDGATADAATDAPADATDEIPNPDPGDMGLTSTAFASGGTIPVVHSVCDGANESIPLAWTGAPGGTQSYAVVMRDLTLSEPPLNNQANYHWVIYDIPAQVTSLDQALPKDIAPDPPGGTTKQTRWSFGADTGFQGMCPIMGPSTHTYELSVYAFSVATLPAAADPQNPAQVDAIIQANKTAHGRLRGTYTKQ